MQTGEVLRRVAFDLLDAAKGGRLKKLKEVNKREIVEGVTEEYMERRLQILLNYVKQYSPYYKEHPEWKELSTKGVKVDSNEQSKRYGVSLIALIVVIGAFLAMYRSTLQAQKEQEEKVGIRQKLQPAMEDIQKQEQSSREAVQSQMKDLLRTPSSSSETEATSGE